jgi:hypothetical protein
MARRQSTRALEREVERLRAEVAQLKAELGRVERERARELGIPFGERERERVTERIAVKPSRKRPPKAATVQSVAREFDDTTEAIRFARLNRIPPHEWAEDLADEFDVDIHDLYEAYYDTDPATQIAA